MIHPDNQTQQYILEIMERRYRNKGTIFCSQFHPEVWNERLGGGALADAIMDRIVARSRMIQIQGGQSIYENQIRRKKDVKINFDTLFKWYCFCEMVVHQAKLS